MRLLFITATRIGDAVLSTGVLARLVARHPGARVTVACGPLAVPLFRAVPGLEAILPVKKLPLNLHWLQLWTRTATRIWDQVVDLRGSGLSYLLAARRRVIMGNRLPGLHRVEELGQLAGFESPPAPRLWLTPEAEAEAARLVRSGSPVLALAPAANWLGKQWRGERFAALAERLTAADGILPGGRIAVFAAPHERAQAEPVLRAAAGRAIDLLDCGDLLIVAAALRRTAFFVGNDSGLMHLAAAAGTPTLGLFGPSPEERYRPWGQVADFVRTPQSCDELTGAPGFDPRTTDTLMDGLTVDAVVAAAQDLWRRCEP